MLLRLHALILLNIRWMEPLQKKNLMYAQSRRLFFVVYRRVGWRGETGRFANFLQIYRPLREEKLRGQGQRWGQTSWTSTKNSYGNTIE